MTISLTVILIECTGDITFGLPIVMVLTIAKWTGDFFNAVRHVTHVALRHVTSRHDSICRTSPPLVISWCSCFFDAITIVA